MSRHPDTIRQLAAASVTRLEGIGDEEAPAWSHDPAMERATLGAMLLDPTVIDGVIAVLTAEDYADHAHADIHRAIEALHKDGRAVDFLTVSDRLREGRRLDAVGGLPYLMRLTEGLLSSAGAVAHAEAVAGCAARRGGALAAAGVIDVCARGGSVDEVRAGLARVDTALGARVDLGASIAPIGEAAMVVVEMGEDLTAMALRILRTRLFWLDAHLRAVNLGRLIIIGGRPGQGKTSLAMQIATGYAQAGEAVLWFSFEAPRDEMVLCFAAQLRGVDQSAYRESRLTPDDIQGLFQAVEEVSKWPLHITDDTRFTLAKIVAAIRRDKQRRGIKAVFIDYLTLIPRGPGEPEDLRVRVGEITRALKALSMEIGLIIVLIAQLNRGNVKDQRAPSLSDLRESGSIEQDADIVLMPWQPLMDKADKNKAGKKGSDDEEEDIHQELPPLTPAWILCPKRRGGRVFRAPCVFRRAWQRFEARDGESPVLPTLTSTTSAGPPWTPDNEPEGEPGETW
ncbi:MAG: AAA family ATPase [Myxococcales bacterium]|nr:AAA family ATPase [Myxococcales bacterium]